MPLSASATAPIMVDALMVVGPKQKLDDKSLWAIDQAIMRGIPVAFFVDIRNLVVNQFYVGPLESGLTDFLKNFGIQLGDRLVYDVQCETIGITQNMGGFAFQTSMRYPYIPTIDRILTTHPVGRGLDTVGLPFVTTVEPIQALPPGVHFSPILYSSPKSWLAPTDTHSSVAPNNIPQPKPDDPHGPFSLGGVVEGTFTSYFQGKPVPAPGQSLIAVSPKTQIFVLGTARLVDPALPQFPGTDGLVSNVMAYLSKDETLAGIRSKGAIIRPLRPMSAPARELIKYGTVLGTALLPILLGLWRWQRRERWRRLISA